MKVNCTLKIVCDGQASSSYKEEREGHLVIISLCFGLMSLKFLDKILKSHSTAVLRRNRDQIIHYPI